MLMLLRYKDFRCFLCRAAIRHAAAAGLLLIRRCYATLL